MNTKLRNKLRAYILGEYLICSFSFGALSHNKLITSVDASWARGQISNKILEHPWNKTQDSLQQCLQVWAVTSWAEEWAERDRRSPDIPVMPADGHKHRPERAPF